MAVHDACVGATDEWYTPPRVFEALGCAFDMDVSHPGQGRAWWVPATRLITEGSLQRDWEGFVWMNPPFGGRGALAPWLEKFFQHGNGIALTPDRTSAPWWRKYAPLADLVLFVAPRIQFIGVDGKPGKSPADGTTLMAVGERGCNALHRAASQGLGVLAQPIIGHSAMSGD